MDNDKAEFDDTIIIHTAPKTQHIFKLITLQIFRQTLYHNQFFSFNT